MCGVVGVCSPPALDQIRFINLQELAEAAYGAPSAWSSVALEYGKRRKGLDLWYTGPARGGVAVAGSGCPNRGSRFGHGHEEAVGDAGLDWKVLCRREVDTFYGPEPGTHTGKIES